MLRMHRMPRKALVFMLLVSIGVLLCAGALAKTMVVTGGSLRLRQDPSTTAAVLSVYANGSKVTVLATSGGWTRVQTQDGRIGWMQSAYLKESGGNGGGAAAGTAWITSGNGLPVNLRSGPGYNYASVNQLAVGTQVTVLSSADGWARVQAGGTAAYVKSEFLTQKQPGGGTTPTVTGTAWVTSANGLPVRLRASASTNGAVLASVAVGTQVTVNGTEGAWSRVSVGTRSGYMMSQYLTANKPGSGAAFTPYTAWVTSANKKGVRLRASAGTGNNIITEVPYAARVTVVGESGAYYRIQYGSQTGFMQKAFVTTTQPGSPVNPGGMQAGGTAWVTSANGQNVNLRKGAGTGYGVIGSFAPATEVKLVQVGNTWCKITIGAAEGWMMTRFLTTTRPATPIKPAGSTWTGYVSATGVSVNLRAAASTNSEKIGEYAIGTQLTVLETEGQWSLITIGGTTGWMMTKFISTAKPASSLYTAWIRSIYGSAVTVYSTNNTYSGTVMTLPVGTTVVVTGTAAGGFRHISYNGKTGYVASENLSATPVSAVKISAEISRTNPKVGNRLSVRVTPAGISVSYMWMDQNGKVLSTAETYVVQNSDLGRTIRVRVTGTGSVSGVYTTEATKAVTY